MVEHAYEAAYNAVAKLFGHDPEAVAMWQRVRRALYFFTSFDAQSAGATKVVAHWISLRKPTDNHTLNRIVEEAIPEYNLVNKNAAVAAMRGEELTNHSHSPLDVRLDRLRMQPTFESYELRSDILSQLRNAIGVGQREQIEGNLTHLIHSHSPGAVAAIYAHLREVGKSLDSDPTRLLRFKQHVNDAAEQLNWTPDQVQESIWTRLTALAAKHQLGIDPKKVNTALNADNVKKGWLGYESVPTSKLADTRIGEETNDRYGHGEAQGLRDRATAGSREGILRSSSPTGVAGGDTITPRHLTQQSPVNPVREALHRRMKEFGFDPSNPSPIAMGREVGEGGEALKLATWGASDFLRSIPMNITDAAPGLVFADWLDENGYSKLADLYRRPSRLTGEPGGNPMTGVHDDRWDLKAWHDLADALQEFGKPATAQTFRGLTKIGNYSGGGPNWMSNGPPTWPKQLWNTLHDFERTETANPVSELGYIPLPRVMQPIDGGWNALTRFRTGGVPISMVPYSTGGTPTHYFTNIGHNSFIPEGELYAGTPDNAAGGLFVPAHIAHQMMHEADVYDSPEDAERAARRTGNQDLVTRLQRSLEPVRLMAHYDQPLDFNLSLDRIQAANQAPFIQGLHAVLQKSGITPQVVTPAIHDFAGQTRASVFAAGQFSNPQAPRMGTAWVGLLGRQPGMLAFRGNPQGKDSIYSFHHHDASIVRNVLQQAGVPSRTIVPEGKNYKVYIFDPQNKLRSNVAKALSQLRAVATEWRGDGKILGGEQDDMGRAQYRGVINQNEGGQ